MSVIPYGRQDIDEADIEAVIDVLRSDFLTQGSAVPAFEKAVADYCGVEFGLAVNSATSALHIACLALGAGPGDFVWTSPITFVASANCALYCGAKIDFVDIDPSTYNMSVEALAKKLAVAEKQRHLPKIVIPVHMCGQSCDMAAIKKLADQYGFKIIEDASHAIGGKYKDKPVGNCHYGDITVFSFHPVKIITTGEGGMALTNDPQLAEKMGDLRSHGVTRDPQRLARKPDGPWYYEQLSLGFNYRMTDIQAALGLNQMQRVDGFIARRLELATRYDQLLAELSLTTPWRHKDNISAFHLYIIRLKLDEIDRTHKDVFEALRENEIGVNLHYMPVYLQPYYAQLGFKPGHCPKAERYYGEAISIPLFPLLTNEQQDQVVGALKGALKC